MTDPNDLIIWPDGMYCERRELHDFDHRSNDYIVLETDSEEWLAFDENNPLKRWEP